MYKAKDIMIKDVITVTKDTPILDALSLLVGSKITGVPVIDENRKPIGIVSEKDLLVLLLNPDEEAGWVEDYMSKQVFHLDANDSMIEVTKGLLNNTFRRIPILENDQLVGIISRRDLLKFLLKLRLEQNKIKTGPSSS